MTATLLGQLLVGGIAIGMVYVILSAGIVYIMSVTGIFFLAYGQFYMIGAMVAWAGVALLGLPFYLALPLAVVATALLGVLSYRFIFQYTTYSAQKFLATIVAAIGLMLIFSQSGLLLFGTTPRSIPSILPGNASLFGVSIQMYKIPIMVLSIAVTLALFWFYEKTRTGRAMRAVAFLPETASLMGINTRFICLASVGIGTALAGFAGALIAPSYGIYPEMGNDVILNVMLIAMLGGIDSLLGAVVAGLLVGQVLSFGQFFFGAGVQIFLFLVVGVIVFFRPGGLLGSGRDIQGFLGINQEHSQSSIVPKQVLTGPQKRIAVLVLFGIFALIPVFVQNPYYLALLVSVGIGSVLAMTFILLLRTGLISMCIAAFWGVGAYASIVMVTSLHMSFWLSLPIASLAAGILALGLGMILIRNPGFTFVIMTMVVGMLFGVIIGSLNLFGGYAGIVDIPRPDAISIPFLPTISFSSDVACYYLLLVLGLIVVAALSAFYSAWTGRAWTAIGMNSNVALSLGINVFRYRLLAFVIAGAAAGLMGSFYAAYLGTIRPDIFNLFKTVYVHVYAVLGGIDFAFLGPFFGSIVMVLFPESMRVTREIETIITGALLILLVIFLPTGVLSLPGVRGFAADPFGSMAKIGRVFRPRPSSKPEEEEA